MIWPFKFLKENMQKLNSQSEDPKSWLGELTSFSVKKRIGKVEQFDIKKIVNCIHRAAAGFEKYIDVKLIVNEV